MGNSPPQKYNINSKMLKNLITKLIIIYPFIFLQISIKNRIKEDFIGEAPVFHWKTGASPYECIILFYYRPRFNSSKAS